MNLSSDHFFITLVFLIIMVTFRFVVPVVVVFLVRRRYYIFMRTHTHIECFVRALFEGLVRRHYDNLVRVFDWNVPLL